MAAILIGGAAVPAQAAVIGYWRYENSGNVGLDSGPNSYNLTNNNSVTSVATVFSNPVPQTQAANTLAIDLELDNLQSLSTTDKSAFAVQDFTIESYVRAESFGGGSTSRIIASQADTGNNNAAWLLGVAGTGSGLGASNLFIQLSKTGGGSSLTSLTSGISLSLNTNYYVAATVDFTSGVGVSVTFYIQNLTSGTAMQATTVTNALDGLYDSTANFVIGGSAGSSTRNFDGLIDETRFSNTALSQSQLLASVPEPSTVGLSMAAAGFLLVALRRKTKKSQ